jgi:hypothetical protein
MTVTEGRRILAEIKSTIALAASRERYQAAQRLREAEKRPAPRRKV